MAEFFKSQQTSNRATAESMIAGYKQLIERAHAKGVKIYGATIAPYEGAMYYSAEGNEVREAINKWIRTSGAFDAVLDFDAVFRDPAKPTQMTTPLQAGDHLHGSDAGYAAVAKSIDLALFK
jgi:lysophospholipase L1-like esterase